MQAKKVKREVGKLMPGDNDTWDGVWDNAEWERNVMVRAFWEWVNEKRVTLSSDLMHRQAMAVELEPFARLGVEKANSPKELPLVVVEYLTTIFEGNDLREKVELLSAADMFHRQLHDECYLDFNMSPAVKELWGWFMEEHVASLEQQEEADKSGWSKIGESWPDVGEICFLANERIQYMNEVRYCPKSRSWHDQKNGNLINSKGMLVHKGKVLGSGDHSSFTHYHLLPNKLPKS